MTFARLNDEVCRFVLCCSICRVLNFVHTRSNISSGSFLVVIARSTPGKEHVGTLCAFSLVPFHVSPSPGW